MELGSYRAAHISSRQKCACISNYLTLDWDDGSKAAPASAVGLVIREKLNMYNGVK
jgi:hypothetical protein